MKNQQDEFIRQRAIDHANFMIANLSTVRQTAKYLGSSKSTVHKDLTERLPQINSQLYEQVRIVLDLNTEERHDRGGQATKKRWKETNH